VSNRSRCGMGSVSVVVDHYGWCVGVVSRVVVRRLVGTPVVGVGEESSLRYTILGNPEMTAVVLCVAAEGHYWRRG